MTLVDLFVSGHLPLRLPVATMLGLLMVREELTWATYVSIMGAYVLSYPLGAVVGIGVSETALNSGSWRNNGDVSASQTTLAAFEGTISNLKSLLI